MKLNEEQRKTVNLLIANMMEANNATPYNAIEYDSNQAAFKAFMTIVLGEQLFKAIDNTNVNWNWYGNNSFADDCQAAIDYEIDYAIRSENYSKPL